MVGELVELELLEPGDELLALAGGVAQVVAGLAEVAAALDVIDGLDHRGAAVVAVREQLVELDGLGAGRVHRGLAAGRGGAGARGGGGGGAGVGVLRLVVAEQRADAEADDGETDDDGPDDQGRDPAAGLGGRRRRVLLRGRLGVGVRLRRLLLLRVAARRGLLPAHRCLDRRQVLRLAGGGVVPEQPVEPLGGVRRGAGRDGRYVLRGRLVLPGARAGAGAGARRDRRNVLGGRLMLPSAGARAGGNRRDELRRRLVLPGAGAGARRNRRNVLRGRLMLPGTRAGAGGNRRDVLGGRLVLPGNGTGARRNRRDELGGCLVLPGAGAGRDRRDVLRRRPVLPGAGARRDRRDRRDVLGDGLGQRRVAVPVRLAGPLEAGPHDVPGLGFGLRVPVTGLPPRLTALRDARLRGAVLTASLSALRHRDSFSDSPEPSEPSGHATRSPPSPGSPHPGDPAEGEARGGSATGGEGPDHSDARPAPL